MINASPSKSRSLCSGPRSYFVIAAFIVVGSLLALPLFTGAASAPTTPNDKNKITYQVNNSVSSRSGVTFPGFNFLAPVPFAGPVTLDTFAGDCTTPKTVYNVQDTDLTVCAKFTNADPSWKVIWSNARGQAVQTSAITAPNSSATFTLTTSSNLGDWRVILFEPFGGTVQAVTPFTVVDAANPKADLAISKDAISTTSSSGGQAIFSLQVTNNGPSDASAVQVTDEVPANTTFASFDQLSGPVFTCTSPNVGDTGSTVCTITNMARGETATFVATYQIGTVSNGTVISNTATVSSTTPDPPNPDVDNNTSSATVDVLNTPCQLSTQENITVSADTGQAGAVVTYTTPTGTGDCGTTTTGEDGETIPAISCNPASGSFFPVGSTTVICTAQTGAASTFQVTVDNPGALSISLNGASTVTLECAQRFGDPGATAVNGSGQSIDVDVSYGGGFNADSPAVGTYTATYTATEGTNSVSTSRTINVTDTEGPAITIDGANPYRIQQGSCSPFVDPGVSATDACAGPKPVTTSISGPGGATSVNTGIAGTYTVTYTATDGTNQRTATRTVIVGTFPEDEVDQPGTSNVPPTITLNGDDQITLECGSAFTDPGATATVCGNPVTVNTSGTVNAHAPGTYTITYSATANGFTSEATRIVTVVDTVAPVITLNGANPMTVGFGTVFTDPGATASDGCAGDLTSAIVVTGSVDTNTVGFYALTYTVSDPSGHSDTKVRTVQVLPYNFTGFFAPIDNLPAFNEMKAGQAAPVKFSLGGDQGLNIFAAGSPSSVQITCDSGAPILPVEQTETAGQSSLSYDATSGQYKYTWKTDSSWKNTCRQLTVTLRDGTVHIAYFKFK
ncbi:MAG TPA: immunoglobulin-like domain-containing protein [Pyrinomonadaceae bacterium]|nr:immunoglobulin-like domain-containing protein [Pyrinomonadaceae bacterium]